MVDLKSSPFLFARKWWIREWITFSIWSRRKKLFWRCLIWKDEILSKIINWILIIIRNKILYAPMMKFIGKRVKRLYSPPINSWILLNKNRYKISTLFSSPSSNRFSRWRNVELVQTHNIHNVSFLSGSSQERSNNNISKRRKGQKFEGIRARS